MLDHTFSENDMDTKICLIDDFYDEPYKIRKLALELDYPPPEENYTYPGKNSHGRFYDQDLHAVLENRLGKHLIYPKEHEAGYFRLSSKDDSFQQDIHVDPIWDVGGVLFLNPPNQCELDSGTSFWYHNKLRIDSVPRNQTEANMLGYTSYDDIRRELIYGDGLDRSKWTRYFLVPFKFNRLVLFDPKLWHSHGKNFGKNKHDSRLVQLFFLNYRS